MPDAERAAQRALEEAVQNYLHATGWSANMVTTGWALIVHQAGFDEDGRELSAYPIMYQGGSMSDHVAIGLFRIGIDTVRGVGRWVNE